MRARCYLSDNDCTRARAPLVTTGKRCDRTRDQCDSFVANAIVSRGARVKRYAGRISSPPLFDRTHHDRATSRTTCHRMRDTVERMAHDAERPARCCHRSARHGAETVVNATAACAELVRYAIAWYSPGAEGFRCAKHVTGSPAASVLVVNDCARTCPALHCQTCALFLSRARTSSSCASLNFTSVFAFRAFITLSVSPSGRISPRRAAFWTGSRTVRTISGSALPPAGLSVPGANVHFRGRRAPFLPAP